MLSEKGGWDTHGLPVELEVEKELGITKADIGDKISVKEYNAACKERVMKFKEQWEDLTTKMGYWVDMDDPYLTYDRDYMETLWYLLKQLYDKGYLYKGYTIQPFSLLQEHSLSSHELNQPGSLPRSKGYFNGCSIPHQREKMMNTSWHGLLLPWTLPSNTALTIGAKIDYVKVETVNPYTHQRIKVILAKELVSKYFSEENLNAFDDYQENGKNLPYNIVEEFKGADLMGMEYDQLLPYGKPEDGDAFKVIAGDLLPPKMEPE